VVLLSLNVFSKEKRKILEFILKSMTITIHSDGGSRGNPGPAAYGYTIHDHDNNLLHEEGAYIGVTTNNVAEYSGVLNSLEWVNTNMSVTSVTVVVDSELVARQLSGIYKIKNENLKIFVSKIKLLEKQLSCPIEYKSVPRSDNKDADRLVNAALDNHSNSF
jgi:ribonuclease HI